MIEFVEAIVFNTIPSRNPGLPLCFRRLPLLALVVVVASARAQVEFSPCHNNYSTEQQIQLGNQSKAQVSKQMPVLPDTSPVTQYIQQLGNKLTQYAPGYKWPYNFHVVNSDEINAFALPGGSIFVNLGTIQAAQDEAQLAGVMAHEISHVVLQHSVCNAAKEQRVGLLAGLGQVAAGVMLGSGTLGQVAERGIQETTSLGFLKMSRADEKQADLEGTGILYDAGYDPHGMSQFFAIIEAKYGEGGAQFLSDHPNPGNRTEYVDKEIASLPARATNTTTSPNFENALKVVSGMHAYTESEIASGAWKHTQQRSGGENAKNKGQRNHPGANNKGGSNGQVASRGKNGQENVGDSTSGPDLTPPTSWKDVQLNGFTIEIPASWRVFRKGTQALSGPVGGVIRATDGNAGSVTYGLMADVYRPEKDATDTVALTSLMHELTSDNSDIKVGQQRDTKVAGVDLQMIECTNPNGRGDRSERYWIVALPESNGGMRYFAFIAPAADFRQMRPTFHHILRSLTVQF